MLLRSFGAAYADVLETHRDLIRAAVTAHGGSEHSTSGDSFFITFPSAREGLAAAVDAQVALTSHDWPEDVQLRVRMGLHCGEVTWAHADAVGLAIHEAAWIAAAAHGGQIVVSSILGEMVADSIPDPVVLRSLGSHHLKDFAKAVELLQVCHPDLPDQFPALRTRSAPMELPVPRSSFVGRDTPLRTVLDLLSTNRLVTLTGTGGAGKTRLAIEAARQDRVALSRRRVLRRPRLGNRSGAARRRHCFWCSCPGGSELCRGDACRVPRRPPLLGRSRQLRASHPHVCRSGRPDARPVPVTHPARNE